MKNIVHEGPQAAQKHLVQLSTAENDLLQGVDHPQLERLVKVDVVLKIGGPLEPLVAEGQIDVPWKHPPQPGSIAVPIQVKIFVTLIMASTQHDGGQIIDGRTQIDVVIHKGPALGEGPVRCNSGTECGEVRAVLILAGLLFSHPDVRSRHAACICRSINLVEGATGIQPHPFGKTIIPILNHVQHSEEPAVGLDPHRKRPVGQHSRPVQHLIRQRITNLAFVPPVGEEIHIFLPLLPLPPDEPVSSIEIKIMSLLRETGC